MSLGGCILRGPVGQWGLLVALILPLEGVGAPPTL